MKRSNTAASLFFLLVIFLFQPSIAQEDSKLSKFLPNYSTDDPSALYNGIPNISIPLYTIKGKGVSVPVSLSYDASGITVAQEATSVGLGWVLNAGGHIIQEVRDWDDYNTSVQRIQDEDSACIIENRGPTLGYRNTCDNLPDYFFYSCNGLSGKFILSPDLSKCLEIPHSSTRIEKGESQGTFIITSDDGVQYNFCLSQIIWKNPYEAESRIYNLSSIYTPQKDTVDFTYYSAEYTKLIPRTKVDGISGTEFRAAEGKEMPMNLVSKISLRGGESIEFELLGDRLDCPSTNDSIPLYEGVKLLDKDGQLKRKFDLKYSYFNSDPLQQYLPDPQLDYYDGVPGGDWLLKGGFHLPYQGSSKYYDSITYNAGYITESGYNVYYYNNGVRTQITETDCFMNGDYLFKWDNGKLYALINLEGLLNYDYFPPFGGIDFPCPDTIPQAQCDSVEEIQYDIAYLQWKKDNDLFFGDEFPTYYSSFSDTSSHYFDVDTAYYNSLVEISGGGTGPFRPYFQSDDTTRRLKLLSIVELSAHSDTLSPPITFEYDSTRLPHFYTNDIDHWGYSNYDGGLPKVSPIPNSYSLFESGSAQPYEPAMKATVLTRINYPYGGYVKYSYEANRARINLSGDSAVIVGGLRLKSVENGTGEGEKYYTNYEYKLFKDTVINGIYTIDTTGVASGNLFSFETQYEVPVGYEIDQGSLVFVMSQVQESVLPLLKTKSGYVGYSEVSVSKTDDSGNSLGRTIYRFHPVDTVVNQGISGCYYTPVYNSAKYFSPTMQSSLPGMLKEKIIVNNWDQILQKTINTYCESEPNRFFDTPSTEQEYYNQYIQAPFLKVGVYNIVSFMDPVSEQGYYFAFPKTPVLSSVHNYTYFPDQGGEVRSDSSFYLYDTYNSHYYMLSEDYMGFVDAIELSSNYVSGLDAYYSDGVGDGFEGFSYQCRNTHKPIIELNFKPSGEKVRTRYWYPPHLEASDTVFEKMVDRNIISSPVKVETFFDTIRMEGQRTKYGVFSKEGSTNEDFLLPSIKEQYFVDHYDPVQEFLSYDNYASPLEVQQANGNVNSSIMRNRGKYQIAAIENAEQGEVLIQDFEEDTSGFGENWKIANQSYSHQEYTKDYAHTGHKSLKISTTNSLTNSFVYARIDADDLNTSGKYTFSAWIKADILDTSLPDILFYYKNQYGTWVAYSQRAIYDSNHDGDWQHLTLEIDLSDYSGVQGIEARARSFGPNSRTYYWDDFRLYPSDALMTTYTYDPLIGKTSEIGPLGQTAIYEYDEAGRLYQVKDDDGNILKQNTYHFKE